MNKEEFIEIKKEELPPVISRKVPQNERGIKIVGFYKDKEENYYFTSHHDMSYFAGIDETQKFLVKIRK
jgi:hypothetical protein